MILNLHFWWALFGFSAKTESFASNLSFALPKRHRVVLHWLLQPVRESVGWAKLFAFFVRSVKVFNRLHVTLMLSGLFAVMIALLSIMAIAILWAVGIDGVVGIYLLTYSVPIGVAFFLSARILENMGENDSLAVWKKVSYGEFHSGPLHPDTPKFVYDRISEVQRKAAQNNTELHFELYQTEMDPILYAEVTADGRIERFAIAVYDFGNPNPLCE